MNTSKRIVGSLVFIVSSVWLLAVQAHPLVGLFQRATRSRSAVVDPLRYFPYPPQPFAPFSWDTWWPVICGFAGVLIGTAFVVASRGSAMEKMEQIEIKGKERNREF